MGIALDTPMGDLVVRDGSMMLCAGGVLTGWRLSAAILPMIESTIDVELALGPRARPNIHDHQRIDPGGRIGPVERVCRGATPIVASRICQRDGGTPGGLVPAFQFGNSVCAG